MKNKFYVIVSAKCYTIHHGQWNEIQSQAQKKGCVYKSFSNKSDANDWAWAKFNELKNKRLVDAIEDKYRFSRSEWKRQNINTAHWNRLKKGSDEAILCCF